MGATKLMTAAGGGITLDAASTATDKTITIPADNGTLVYANSSGNVGIGTSSPAFSSGGGLHVNVAGAGPSIVHLTTGNQGTTASDGLDVKFYAGDATLWNYETGYMAFATSNAERARIDSSGNLLVGTTTAGGVGQTIYVNASGRYTTFNTSAPSGFTHCVFQYNGTSVGNIQTTTTATSYVTSSDYRLKENIAPMTGALSVVQQLKPVTYNWKVDGSDGQGFIAHELQAVVPECVTGEKDAVDADGNPVYQGIDTSFLVATLTAAIQELKAELDAAKADIAALKGTA